MLSFKPPFTHHHNRHNPTKSHRPNTRHVACGEFTINGDLRPCGEFMSTINGDLRPCGEFTSTGSCGRDEECAERDESGDLRPSYHYKCGEFPSTGFFGRDGKCQSGYVWKVMPTGVVRVRCGCCCWHRQNLLCSLCVAWGFVEQRQQRSHFLLTCKLSLQDESGKCRCRIHSAFGHHVL